MPSENQTITSADVGTIDAKKLAGTPDQDALLPDVIRELDAQIQSQSNKLDKDREALQALRAERDVLHAQHGAAAKLAAMPEAERSAVLAHAQAISKAGSVATAEAHGTVGGTTKSS